MGAVIRGDVVSPTGTSDTVIVLVSDNGGRTSVSSEEEARQLEAHGWKRVPAGE